jgi:DnaJ family protein C protein 28
MNWDLIIEQKIRDAQAEGKFDNLSGKGRPLNLDENPFEDPAWTMANDLLKANGFRPDWLEDDVALREKLAGARQALARTRDWRTSELEALGARDDAAAIQQRLWITEAWDSRPGALSRRSHPDQRRDRQPEFESAARPVSAHEAHGRR